jgi:hypothetical protein
MKVIPVAGLRNPKEVSAFLQDEIRELQSSGKKVLQIKVGVQRQVAQIPPVWRKALGAFPKGATLADLFSYVVGGLGGSGITKGRTLSIENLQKRKHALFLSTLRRFRDDQVLAVYPSSALDENGSLAWMDMGATGYWKAQRTGTRADWIGEMSKVRVVPNLSKLKKNSASQAPRVEERTIVLRKKGEDGSKIIVQGLTTKPIHIVTK